MSVIGLITISKLINSFRILAKSLSLRQVFVLMAFCPEESIQNEQKIIL